MPLRIEHPGLEQRAERAQSQADALRVVEPVDAEQDHLRVAEPRPDLGDALAGGASGGDLLDLVDVDRDREHAELDRPTVEHDDVVALGHVEELIGRGGEVGHTARGLEADQIAAEQALDDLGSPRQPGEQLERRERDVEEESDRQVGPPFAEHRRHQLQVVVVDPHGGVRRRHVGQLRGEPLVDR